MGKPTKSGSATIPGSGRVGHNRHPVDELADVRAEIKILQDRESALRDTILAEGCTLDGHEFEASVTRVSALKLDTKAVRKAFGDIQLAPYLKPTETVTLRVKAIDRSHLAEDAA